jgi:hypothetical protein
MVSFSSFISFVMTLHLSFFSPFLLGAVSFIALLPDGFIVLLFLELCLPFSLPMSLLLFLPAPSLSFLSLSLSGFPQVGTGKVACTLDIVKVNHLAQFKFHAAAKDVCIAWGGDGPLLE